MINPYRYNKGKSYHQWWNDGWDNDSETLVNGVIGYKFFLLLPQSRSTSWTWISCLCQPWGTPDLSLSGSHSSGLRIENCFFCLFPYSVRNFLDKFGILLSTVWTGWEPVQPVQHHSWLPLSAMRNPWPFFVRFSLIRARNWEPFLLFISLFS